MKKTNKTKILYIGPIPPEVGGQAYGGIATHVWEIATQANKHGYDVFILANTPSSFAKNGIKIITPPPKNKLLKVLYAAKSWLMAYRDRVNFLTFIGFKEKLGMLYRAYCLREVLKTIKPDLIHVHSLHNSDNLVLKIIQPHIPIVITDHGAFRGIKDEKDLTRVSNALSVASIVICVSRYAKKRLQQLYQNYRRKPFVINNPISVNKLPLLNRERMRRTRWGKKKIVFFSGVTEPIRTKRLDLLLSAFSADDILRDNCRLLILAGENGVRYAKEFISRNKIDGIVLSPRSWDEIVEYYTISDVFVMPSVLESFGIVYVEALLAGTPIVGFHETLKELESSLNTRVGEKFDPSREGEKELAQKIKKVINSDYNRKLLRKRVVKNLSWDANFGEFDSVYRDVIHANKSHRYSVSVSSSIDIERFAKEHPQSEFYESEIPGIRLLHENRLKSILCLISRAVNSLPTAYNGCMRSIDIGCGDGYVLKEIVKNFPHFDLIGIDLSETRLRRAKKLLSNVAFVKADAQKIPFRTGSFNIAVCTEVIEHIPDDVCLLQEIRRILNQNGFLILTTPNLYTFERIAPKIILNREVKISNPDHLREYSWRDLESKMRKTRFNILNFQSTGFYIPYMTLFFKSKILTRLLFYFSRLLPKMGRIFVILAKSTC